jgi:hypothetical protein
MTAPRRIQRKRSKCWRKPPGAVNVTRPSKWGNPFKLADYDDPADCLSDYGAHLDVELAAGRLDLAEIRGKDLMCFCKVGDPCHGDILLEAANGRSHGGKRAGAGRPPIADHLKRKARGVRWTDREWAAVQADAKRAGISAARYIRRAVLGGDFSR